MFLRRLFFTSFLGFCAAAEAQETRAYEFAPAPVDNPMKGMVPYVTADAVERFPHSLEFAYFSMRELMPETGNFDWSTLESTLETTQSRGCQLVARVYLEYPDKPTGIPQDLIDDGLKIVEWVNEDDGNTRNLTPDYTDPRLIQTVELFIGEFGRKYNGDPRIGFLHAGFLGSWGEWHTWPREDLWAPRSVQAGVLNAYAASFPDTHVLLRYPAGFGDPLHQRNSHLKFGYHDDSFAWGTIHTGQEDEEWFFETLLMNAVATDKWKYHPIGGELRPELWETSFQDPPHPRDQGFVRSVEQLHATWLMDSGLFEKRFALPESRLERAKREVGRLGYEFQIFQSNWEFLGRDTAMTIKLVNRGVAPFYDSWPVEIAAFRNGDLEWTQTERFRLQLLPDELAEWTTVLQKPVRGMEMRIRIPHPMEGGKPLRFANAEQDEVWMVLGTF